MRPDRVIVGRVESAHGLRGHVTVRCLSDVPDRFAGLDEVLLRLSDGSDRTCKIIRVQPYKKGLRIAFDGVEDRDAAEALRGAWLTVDGGDLPDLPDDTFYVFDLLDLSVVTEAGRSLGRVDRVLSGTGNDVIFVRSKEDGEELLLPAIRDVIRRVDMARGEIVVHLLPGLET